MLNYRAFFTDWLEEFYEIEPRNHAKKKVNNHKVSWVDSDSALTLFLHRIILQIKPR